MPGPTGAVLRVANALLRKIVGGEYSPGLRLPSEVDLASEFACGRSTVREALRHLGGLNLVQSRRGSGAVVLDFRREGVLDLMPVYFQYGNLEHPLPVLVHEMLRMRKTLACEAARLAALYASPESLAPVRRQIEATHAMRGMPLEHSLRELEVYRSLTHASAIWPAAWLANAFIGPMRAVHELVANPLSAVSENWLESMNQLMGLIEAREADEAVAFLDRYFTQVDQLISSGLAQIFNRQRR